MQNDPNPYGAPGGGPPQQPIGQPGGAPVGGGYGPPPGTPVGVPGPGGFQPPGGPGGPGGFPPPGGPGGFPPPGGIPPAPGRPYQFKRRRNLLLRIAIPVAILAVFGILGYFGVFDSATDRASVGDCLNVKEFKEGKEPAKVDCGDPSANVKIGVRLDSDAASCPNGEYDEYTVSGSGAYKLCLMLNAREGECWANVTDTTEGYKRVDCADPAAQVRILKVVAGQDGEEACRGTEYDVAVTYSKPPTTLCAVNASKHNT